MVLTGKVAEEVSKCVKFFSEQQVFEIVELKIQFSLVHVLALFPAKVSIPAYVAATRDRTAFRAFNRFREFKKKP